MDDIPIGVSESLLHFQTQYLPGVKAFSRPPPQSDRFLESGRQVPTGTGRQVLVLDSTISIKELNNL